MKLLSDLNIFYHTHHGESALRVAVKVGGVRVLIDKIE